MIRGDLGVVRAQVKTYLAQAEASGDEASIMAMHHVAGVTAEFMGDFVESYQLLERARELHDPSQHRAYTDMFGMDPGMVARAMSARPLWVLGRPDAALARSRETLALSDSQRQPVTRIFSLIVQQSIHLFRGETAEAIRLGDEIIAIGTEYEFPQEVEWGRAFQGSAIALAGGADDGVVQLQRALSSLHDLKSGLVRTLFLSHLADALHRAGRVEEGLAAVNEGFAHSERTQERGFSAELHRLRGELLRLAGNRAAAHDSLRLALEHARRQHARSLALRAAISLARLEQGTPGGALAASELTSTLDSFTEGHDTMDLVAARTLLSEMG
jgi:adenylate cyclase